LVCAMVLVGIWLSNSTWLRKGWLRIAAALLLMAAATVGHMIANRNPLFAERILADVAANSFIVIHTDPETRFRGDLLYRWRHVSDKITASAPQAGDLFLFNPKFANVRTARTRNVQLSAFVPDENWIAQRRIVEPRSILARVIATIRLDALLPAALWQRIEQPNPPVTLYRVVSFPDNPHQP